MPAASTCASSVFAPWRRRAWACSRSNIAAMPVRPARQASAGSSSTAKRLMRRRSRAALRRSASSLMGESLGSGVAVALAARHKVGALVLNSPYSSIADVAAARLLVRSGSRVAARSVPHRFADRPVTAPDADGARDEGPGRAASASARNCSRSPMRRRTFSRVEGAGHLALGERLAEILDWIARTVG